MLFMWWGYTQAEVDQWMMWLMEILAEMGVSYPDYTAVALPPATRYHVEDDGTVTTHRNSRALGIPGFQAILERYPGILERMSEAMGDLQSPAYLIEAPVQAAYKGSIF